MWFEFAERHRRAHWRTVVQDVEVAVLEVHNPLPAPVLDVRILNVPLFRNCPIEDGCSRRYVEGLQRNLVLDHGQGPTDSVAGNAPANRVQFLRKPVQFLANLCRIFLIEFLQQSHYVIQISDNFDLVQRSLLSFPAKQSEMLDHQTALPGPIPGFGIPTFDRKLQSPLPRSESRARIPRARKSCSVFQPSRPPRYNL